LLEEKNIISLRDVSIYYGEKRAVSSVSLDVSEHSVFSLIGPSGSGLTTLLRSLNRLIDLLPAARVQGQILLRGEDVYAHGVDVTELRRRLGMVFDIPTPLPLSIIDNVTYGPRLNGKKSKQALAEIAETALRAAALWDDVKERLKAPAMSLSGGQQQRLCIARVLALEPEVILLDRPCSGLDPISTAKIEESLLQLKEKLTVIIAPHNVQQAGRISDDAAFMLSGELIEQGPASKLFTGPEDKRTNDYITGRFG
jgi:phosphate transport system ATP-binding protein